MFYFCKGTAAWQFMCEQGSKGLYLFKKSISDAELNRNH